MAVKFRRGLRLFTERRRPTRARRATDVILLAVSFVGIVLVGMVGPPRAGLLPRDREVPDRPPERTGRHVAAVRRSPRAVGARGARRCVRSWCRRRSDATCCSRSSVGIGMWLHPRPGRRRLVARAPSAARRRPAAAGVPLGAARRPDGPDHHGVAPPRPTGPPVRVRRHRARFARPRSRSGRARCWVSSQRCCPLPAQRRWST